MHKAMNTRTVIDISELPHHEFDTYDPVWWGNNFLLCIETSMFAILIAVELFYGIRPSWPMLAAPLFAILTALMAFAICLWLSALDALYRDVRYALTFLMQVWYFATPIIYPLSIVPERFRWIMTLNPLAAAVQGFRWSMLGNVAPPPTSDLVVAVVVTFVLLLGGAMFFRRIEQRVIDMI